MSTKAKGTVALDSGASDVQESTGLIMNLAPADA